MTLLFRGPGKVPLTLNVNGEDVAVLVEPRRTLLSVLREELSLTGAKRGCGRGQCGACTVIIDDATVYACLTLAIDCEGRRIRTIEGLTDGDQLHPVQDAFIQEDGYQCGFCTPGQVMSAVSLLEHNPHIDATITVPHRRFRAVDLLRAWWQIKRSEFTVTIDPQGLLKSAGVTWMSDAPLRIGKEEAREVADFAYNEIIPERWDQTYVSQRYLELCEPLGVSRDDYVPEITLVEEDFQPANELFSLEGLNGPRPVIALAPFAAEARKEWPAEYWVRLGDMLAEQFDARIIIPGSAKERERAEALSAAMKRPALVFAGKTNMREAAAFLSKMDLFVGGESGLTHMAFAVGTPQVCIVGPTPLRNGPKAARARAGDTFFVLVAPAAGTHVSGPLLEELARLAETVEVEGQPVEVTRIVTETETVEVTVEVPVEEEEPEAEPEAVDRRGGWLDTIVVVEEPDANSAVARLEAGDLEDHVFQEPGPEEPWGAAAFAGTDPNGHALLLVQVGHGNPTVKWVFAGLIIQV